MQRHLLNIIIVISLILQGAMAFAAAPPVQSNQQQHCASHQAQGEHCPCCSDSVGAAASCTVQCSVVHAATAMTLPVRLDTQPVAFYLSDRLVNDPAYVPLVPPPIR